MIDITLLREKTDELKKAVEDKQLNPAIIDDAVDLDKKWREILRVVEELRKERNALSKSPTAENITSAKQVKEELKKLEKELYEVTDNYDRVLNEIPNPALPDVKVGKNDTENDIVRTWREPRKFTFEPKPHWELTEKLGMVDTERAAKVSGARFFYLKGDGVLLDQALVRFGFDMLLEKGFIPVIPPVLIKTSSMKKMGYMEHGGEEDMYLLKEDDLALVATSEQSIGPMHMDELFRSDELPKRYMGYSSCFRRESGSYGKDTKGAFRVHQFNKVEMFSYVKPEDGDTEHEFMLAIEEELLQKLGIPYEVSKMCTGDLGLPAARKYDLNGWFPSENKYRELTSTSTVTDFQARRLNIKYQDKSENKFVHMLNGTVFSQRPILAILENYQQEDGSIIIPEALRKYMGGKEKITP